MDEMKSEIKRASSVLGYEHETIYEGMDLIEKLDTVPQRDLVDVFEARLNEHRPDLLLLPHGVDFDQDHVSCYRAAFAAARPIPTALGKHLPGKVLTYESPKLAWSQEPFQPEVYWDITAEIEDKLRAIAAYKTQLRSPPHVRSLDNVRALAHIRGAEIGVVHAEAYNCLRWMP